MKNFYLSIFFSNRFFIIMGIIAGLFVIGHFFPFVYVFSKVLLLFFVVASGLDILFLYSQSNPLMINRQVPGRLSNGDINKICIRLKNNSRINFNLEIIDELPFQFQKRDFKISSFVESGNEKIFEYSLKPHTRGEYEFGRLNVFIKQRIGLIIRRLRFDLQVAVPVYPSFIQMRKYELLAVSNRLTEAGIKKIRRLSHTLEFEQIKEYVQGDDYRTINWKATARRSQLMVNQYLDEKSQKVFCIIDMGRNMKMPFEGMTLLDYAINSSLVLSNIAMLKHDRAGLITFSHKIHSLLPAERSKMQMKRILESLYNQETNFSEPNFEQVYATVKRKVNQRSLLVLFTNFEWHISMMRQINYLRQLNKHHLLLVVFFKNTELYDVLLQETRTVNDIYLKTVVEKLNYEKRLIVRELKKYGIQSILTEPQNLSVQTINKYLQLKAMGQI
ncbi:MAG: DUF58 domain-containing protein [Bacteroidales bacterium]|nr:DUF58 domain-containing protein [Bacteroidales bacterium]